MDNEILQLCAYHESGRVVAAYLSGYTCDGMELSSVDPGRGKSALNGGDDTPMIKEVLSGNPVNVAPEDRNRAIEVASKLMILYCSGSTCKALFENDGNIDASVDLDVPVQDYKQMEAIQKFLKALNPQHADDFVAKTMAQLFIKMKTPELWKAVDRLAKAAIEKEETPLTRFEIEDNLMAAGIKVKRQASAAYNVGVHEDKSKREPAPVVSATQTPTQPTTTYNSAPALDILLKDFFKTVRNDWSDDEAQNAVKHVKEIFAKYGS